MAGTFTRDEAYVDKRVIKIARKMVHKQQRYDPFKLGGVYTFI